MGILTAECSVVCVVSLHGRTQGAAARDVLTNHAAKSATARDFLATRTYGSPLRASATCRSLLDDRRDGRSLRIERERERERETGWRVEGGSGAES